MFLYLSRCSIETVFRGFETRLKFIKFGLSTVKTLYCQVWIIYACFLVKKRTTYSTFLTYQCFKSTIVNLAFLSLHRGSIKIMLTIPLRDQFLLNNIHLAFLSLHRGSIKIMLTIPLRDQFLLNNILYSNQVTIL